MKVVYECHFCGEQFETREECIKHEEKDHIIPFVDTINHYQEEADRIGLCITQTYVPTLGREIWRVARK